jgi:hypothetical protein
MVRIHNKFCQERIGITEIIFNRPGSVCLVKQILEILNKYWTFYNNTPLNVCDNITVDYLTINIDAL